MIRITSNSTPQITVNGKSSFDEKANKGRITFEEMTFLNEDAPVMKQGTTALLDSKNFVQKPATLNKASASVVADAKNQASKKEDAQSREVADQFESMFIQMMLKSMRDTLPQDSMLGDSNEEKTYQTMLDQVYAENWSKSRTLGLSDMIMDFLSRNQTTTQVNPLKIVEDWRTNEG